ncbi:hypothetical protein FNV43_RR10760 [Rhamnella rubrinervis]|uniref:Uncharacterized protein n=1 Tax=Rhamnella rubrinervis TaxID=2594499 RepID=A0A8K0H4P1_9ROSA|nr:hypothetical protein FNV43_RR10760 [Rhamnella rubrinervis]
MTSTTPSSFWLSSSKNVPALGYSRFRPKNVSENIVDDNGNDYNNEIETTTQETKRRQRQKTSKHLRLKAARNRFRESCELRQKRVRKLLHQNDAQTTVPVFVTHSLTSFDFDFDCEGRPPEMEDSNICFIPTYVSNWKNGNHFVVPLDEQSANLVDEDRDNFILVL